MGDAAKIGTGIRRHYPRTVIASARQMERIGREIHSMSMSPDVIKGPTQYKYPGSGGGSSETWTIQHSKPANNQCKLTAGTITLGGEDYEFAGGTVTLTGVTEFVYVRVTYGNTSSAVIGHASIKPVNNSTYFFLTCVGFTATDGSWNKGIIRWKGDYNGAQPIV